VKNGRGQYLLVDADDTLWENNIYFERVIRSAQELLLRFGVEPHAFREQLNQTERGHIPIHGYGTRNFTRSLVKAFESRLPPDADPSLSDRVRDLGLGIMSQPLEIFDEVPETLEYLSARHSLFLVTKGDPAEQRCKVERSKLKGFFRSVEILTEKNVQTYRHLVEKHGLDPNRTWMVGNSPRSDVNPAISAGLNAVYIPHVHTWVLEHEPPVKHPCVLELERFGDLRLHF